MKINIWNTFDTLSWHFFLKILTNFGFSDQFCNWILIVLQFARISILLNGLPRGYVSCSQDVKQEYSLFLLLFVIAEEYLSRSISSLVERSLLRPITSHGVVFLLLTCVYADDVILFCNGSISNLKVVMDLFRNYGMLSSQIVN